MSDRSAVVIGGGITGTLTACRLAEAGFRVTLLEGAHLGAGSSSRSAAGIRQQFSTPDTVRAMRYSVAFYRDFARWSGANNIPIVQSGYLFLYDDAAAWSAAVARVDVQRAAGLAEVRALAGQALRDAFPWADGEALVGGTFCPTDGFLMPQIVYNDAADYARRLGVTVVQRARVVGGAAQGGRLQAVHTARGTYAADLFLDCTNAWTLRLGAALGASPLPVDPLKRYLWFLRRGPDVSASVLSAMPLCIAPTGAYFRPENADTLLLGKKHDTPPQPRFTDDEQDRIEPPFAHTSGVEAVPYGVWGDAAEAVPMLGSLAGVVATTAGFYATTPDHNPYLGYDLALHNLIRLVGFSGHGAMLGPFTAAVGLALAEAGGPVDHLRLGDADVSLAPFALGRAFDHSEAMVL